MSAEDVLKKLPAAFNADAASGTNAVLQFNSSKPHYATIKDGTCTVTAGTAPSPDLTITMEDADLEQLLKGELNGMTAFMTGKLKIEGDMGVAMKLQSILR